jgi:hypothetical protein
MNLFSTDRASPPTIPTLQATSPKLAELELKLAELALLASPLRVELFNHNQRKREGGPSKDSRQPLQAANRQRVAALAGTKPPTVEISDDQRLAECEQKLADLDAAYALCHSLRETERARASAIICTQLKDEYSKIVAEICAALRVVHAANLKHHEFLDALGNEGIQTTSLAIVDQRILNNPDGHPKDRFNMMSFYFAQAKERGHIDNDAIPTELRH